MDHPYLRHGKLVRAAKRIDAWALDNPLQAAAVGAALGLVSSVAMNRLLVLKGTVGLASAAYGAIKGGISGYAYPAFRRSMLKNFGSF